MIALLNWLFSARCMCLRRAPIRNLKISQNDQNVVSAYNSDLFVSEFGNLDSSIQRNFVFITPMSPSHYCRFNSGITVKIPALLSKLQCPIQNESTVARATIWYPSAMGAIAAQPSGVYVISCLFAGGLLTSFFLKCSTICYG